MCARYNRHVVAGPASSLASAVCCHRDLHTRDRRRQCIERDADSDRQCQGAVADGLAQVKVAAGDFDSDCVDLGDADGWLKLDREAGPWDAGAGIDDLRPASREHRGAEEEYGAV
jgi:hypothetical protein